MSKSKERKKLFTYHYHYSLTYLFNSQNILTFALS